MVAFVEQKVEHHALRAGPWVILLSEYNDASLKENISVRQCFDMVEFNRGELISIERFYAFNQTEFLM